MYLIPIIGIFMSSVMNIVFGRFIGHRGALIITSICLIIAFISSIIIWNEVVLYNCPVSIDIIGVWFSVGSLEIAWNLNFDLLTAHIFLTVTGVSTAVHLYSFVYIKEDPNINIFLSYLSLFTGFILVLVAADNLVIMLIGWEGIGVCSYLLISYYSHRLSATKSAVKAIIVNRISDGVLLSGIMLIWWNLGSLEYDLLQFTNTQYATWFIGLALIIGAIGKSAQVLFHVWLASAMEGPTPVSALIHAATLVTAGVYLMIRTNTLLPDSVVLIGALTGIMAGVFALYQYDIKRIIAYSTCSQLGYIIVSVGLGELGAEATIGHLMTHASFKAALFLSAGLIITASQGNKNLGRYGGLSGIQNIITTYLIIIVCSISLIGWPETSGFYSKEVIINLVYNSTQPFGDYAHTILLLAAFITSLYSAKLFYQCFFIDFSGSQSTLSSDKGPLNVLILLAFFILLLDVVLKVWIGTNLLNCILTFTPFGVKTLPFILVLGGLITGVSILSASTTVSSKLTFIWVRFSGTRWGFDQIFARSLVYLILDWGRISWFIGDKAIFSVNELKV